MTAKMTRQSSSRNQRARGIRVKHILQICMLLAVCFWLSYQVKHSYDKRKHFEENDSENPGGKLPKFDEVIKLGRKDLRPRDAELSTDHEKIDDEEVEDEEMLGKGNESLDETQEELERKRKEEGSADIEALLDGTSRGEDEAGGQVGDDDIDEQDLDKAEKEADGDLEGDKDIEKDEEDETDEKGSDEVSEHQRENDGSSDDQDRDSNGDRHEAREEHYKADDASSAVAHVGQNILTEDPERKNVGSDLDALEHDDSSEVDKEQHLNATNVLRIPPRLEDVPVKNDTNDGSGETVDSTQLIDGRMLQLIPQQNSTTISLSDHKTSYTTNWTEHSPTVTINTIDANVEQKVNSNSTMSQDFSPLDLVASSNLTTTITTATSTNQTDSLTTDEHEDATHDRTDTEEDSILSSLNDDETLRDPLISEEEDKEIESRIDLDTLPEVRTEGADSDDAATE